MRGVARTTGVWLMAALLTTLLSGCASLGYLAHTVGGHLDLLQRARPVDDWLADPGTPPVLREQLSQAQQLRTFAVQTLHLPDGASYRRHAQIDRPAVVWNVVATPELSLELKTWWVPVAGRVAYRGHFDRERAQALAERLRSQRLDVHVYGVPAYSTLGRTDWLGGDPLLSTFVHWPQTELARLLFHEMAHQVVYVRDDTAFNESYATAVERLGLQRWLAQAGPDAVAEHVAREARREDFRRLTRQARQALDALYRSSADDATKRQGKADVLAALRAEHAALKAGPWAGHDGLDPWFAQANNAALAVLGAYDDLVPEFIALFEREGADFQRFHAAVRRLAALPREQRRQALQVAPKTSTISEIRR
ncbi:MAG: aminopeptidase [Rubrivivax sp.]